MTMDYKLIGVPCGHHGPYTFYKAFKYSKNGNTNILALSDFFFVKLWNDSDFVSIGELQLLWKDKNTEQTLASLRLYILPENTPEGRNDFHGEDEVLAISEKVVIRVEDLLTWITDADDWTWGLSAVWNRDCTGKKSSAPARPQLLNDCAVIDLEEVDKEKDLLDESHWEKSIGVVVLSFPRYCRYRGVLKRLEGVHNKWLRTALVVALGGFTVPCRNTRVLYCKDTFDYPDLEGHELLCNHLAPKLKGRPRKKRKRLSSRTPSPEESEESESESSVKSSNSSSSSSNTNNDNINISNNKGKISLQLNRNKNGLSSSPRRSSRAIGVTLLEKEFLSKLHALMKSRQTPINRVPTIGFKEIDLYTFYNKVKHLGGYDAVTASRLWKYVYEEMGGDQNSTSAATISRRHYERLLLPFERQFGGHNSVTIKGKQITDVAASTTPATTTATTTITTTTCASPTDTNVSPSVTISPSVTATLVTVPRSQANVKDKNAVGPAGKSSSLRGIRLKPVKPNGHNTVEVKNGGKENIPVRNTTGPSTPTSTSPVKHHPVSTEFIDLISEDSQSPGKVGGNTTSLPSLKKQKLDILKEGGLEVTPVTGAMSTTSSHLSAQTSNDSSANENCKNGIDADVSDDSDNRNNNVGNSNNNNPINNRISNCSAKSNRHNVCNIKIPQLGVRNSMLNQNNSSLAGGEEVRPSVIKHAHPDSGIKPNVNNSGGNKNNKISITITPDVSSLLTMGGLTPQLSPHIPSSPTPIQHRSTQHLPSLWSGKTVYGNPKDVFQQPIKRPVAEEVLDLRTKNDGSKNSHPQQNSKSTKNIVNPAPNSKIITTPYGQFGSNLEITLVPASKSDSPGIGNSTYKGNVGLLPNHNPGLLMQHQQKRSRKSQMNPPTGIYNNGNMNRLNNISFRSVADSNLLNSSNSSKHHSGAKMSSIPMTNNASLVVPNVSLTINQRRQSDQTQRIIANHTVKVTDSLSASKHQNNISTVSSSSSSSRPVTPVQHRPNVSPNAAYQQILSSMSSFPYNSKMPFIPAAAALDPIYLSALFNGLLPRGLIPPSSTSQRQQSNHVGADTGNSSNPTPEQLQSYRELLRRHSLPHTTLPDGFPRLINDGSTSITLVNSRSQSSTPTTK